MGTRLLTFLSAWYSDKVYTGTNVLQKVLCAVTNWMLLFLTGLGSRRRELALRTVSGSTNGVQRY